MSTVQLGPRRSIPQLARQDQANLSVTVRPATQPSPLVLHRSRQSQAAQSAASPSPSAIDAFATRSPELVWRTHEPPAADASGSTQGQPASASSTRATSATPAPNAESSDDTQAVRAALRTQSFDPAFVNRVADDVIRRIDHRLRIERERRGL